MKYTKMTQSALLAASYLASRPRDNYETVEMIAKGSGVRYNGLHFILKQLSNAGIVKCKFGREGGYALGKEPDKISLFDIIKAIDNSAFEPFTLAELIPNNEFVISISKACEKAVAEYDKILKKTTLAEIVNKSK